MSSIRPRRADFRAMIGLAVPVATVQIGLMMLGVVDTMIVGHLSATALASVAVANLYFWSVVVFSWGVMLVLDPIISQAVGAGDTDGIARGLQRGIVIAIVLGLILSTLLLPVERVLRFLRQPESIIPDAATYVRICIPSLPGLVVFFALRQTLQALGTLRPIVIVMIVANLVNLLLAWMLVFGRLGAPALGVAGSAIATSGVRLLMPVAVAAMSWAALRPLLRPWRADTLSAGPLLRMIRHGVPIGLQTTIEYVAFGIVAVMMGWLGEIEIAAHQIALNLAALTFMVPQGVAAAAAVLVGRAIGAGDEGSARRSAAAALILGVGFMSFTAVAFLVFPHVFASLYTNDRAAFVLAASLIPIAGVFQVFDGTQSVASGILRGAGDTHMPMVINLLGYGLVGIPVSMLLAFKLGMRAHGLWWGLVAGLVAVALFLLARVVSRLGRSLRRLVVESEPVA